jgi:hypothetical protein
VDTSEKIFGELIVAHGDGTKVLEFIEEALDEIALATPGEIASAGVRRKPTIHESHNP